MNIARRGPSRAGDSAIIGPDSGLPSDPLFHISGAEKADDLSEHVHPPRPPSHTLSGPGETRRRGPLDCRDCGSRLAVDQRYCVNCGTRARGLPAHIRYTLVALARGHRWEATTPPPLESPRTQRPWLAFPSFELPTPRAAAASVLGILAFGVLVGSGSISFASLPLNLVVNGIGGRAAVNAAGPVTDNASAGTGGSTGGSGAPSAGTPSSDSGNTGTPSSGSPTNTGTTTTASTTPLPPIKHVWVITMGTQGYSKTFSVASGNKYLSKTLAAKGEIVPQYFGVTQGELANEIAMISGQGPTPQTEAGCAQYRAIKPGTVTKPHSQVSGQGCVYPKRTQTLASELEAKHDTWKAYVQDLGAVVKLPPAPKTSPATTNTTTTAATTTTTPASTDTATTTTPTTTTAAAARAARRQAIKQVGTVNAADCRHPAVGTTDRFQNASRADKYATWRDPFVYFRSVTGAKACNNDVVGLTSLAGDLKSASTTPSVSYIYADPCDDGSSAPCYRGAPSGGRPADQFLSSIVPQIMDSAAYKQSGLILITFAQAPQTGRDADSTSCCENPTTYPNVPAGATSGTGTTPTTTTTTPTTTTPTTTTPAGTTTTSTTTTSTTGTTTTPYNLPGATSSCSTSDTTTSGTTTSTTTTPTTTSTTTTTTPTTTSTTPTTTTGTTTTGTTTTDTGTTTTPSTTTPSTTTPCTVPAGGQVGLLAISQYINPGTSDYLDSFNHFSLLGSIEQLFGLKRLGYAATGQLPLFGSSFYSDYTPA